MPKQIIAWAVVHKADGRIDISSVRWNRREAVAVWSKAIPNKTWDYWKSRGWTAQKVVISVYTPPAAQAQKGGE